MEQASSSRPGPLKRRPSFFSRARNRIHEAPARGMNSCSHADGTDDNLRAKVKEAKLLMDDMSGIDEKGRYDGLTPQSSSTRKPRASFSGFGHLVCTFPKRFVSHRRKASMTADNALYNDYDYGSLDISLRDEKSMPVSSDWVTINPSQSRTPGWLRRCVSTRFRPRRQTADTPSRPATAQWARQDIYSSPVPLSGFVQPTFPDDLSSGAAARAAARAAAAEENEMRRCRCLRRLYIKERRVRGESAESGVGIDVWTVRRESTIARLGNHPRLYSSLESH